MVLQLIIVTVEVVGLLLAMRQDETEKRQGRIITSQQEGVIDSGHVAYPARPDSFHYQLNDTQRIVHGCKGTNKREKIQIYLGFFEREYFTKSKSRKIIDN